MSEPFPVSGNIESMSFPYVLVNLYRQGATGSLKVTGAGHPKALYFRGGRVLFGSSNDPRDQLGAILIEAGKVTREQLDEVNAKVGPGNPLAKVLAESGFVNQRELADAARHKVERILADVLSWDSGSFEFEDGVLPKGAVDLKLSTEKLLLAAVQSIPDRAFALRHVELGSVLEPVPGGDAALTEVRADVWPLLERLDGQRSLKDAIALTRLDDFEAAKTACALLFLGAVKRRAAADSPELDLAEEAQMGFAGPEVEAEPETVPEAEPMTRPMRAVSVETTGFAFVEETAPGAAEPVPPVTFSLPAEPETPFPFPSAVPEPPIDGAAETIALPYSQEPVFQPDADAEETLAAPRPPDLFGQPLPPMPETVLVPPPAGVEPTIVHEPLLAPEPSPPLVAPPSNPSEPPPAWTPEPASLRRPPSFNAVDDSSPTIPPGPDSSRPSEEDLAALDALLHPPARTEKPALPARDEKWEPQFRPTPPTPPTPPAPRRPPARVTTGGSSSPSRLPVLVTALAALVLTTIAAWYFFLRSPRAATPTPRPIAVATPRPTPLPAPSPTAPTTLDQPAVATTPTPAPVAAARPTPSPTAAPLAATATVPGRPAATPAPRPAIATPDEGRTLLGQGSLPEAARAFAVSLAGSRGRYSAQLLTACAPETVHKAVAAGGTELFILPINLQGRACYRVCWGVHDGRAAAEAALGSLPAYFRQGGVRPRLSTIGELLP
jgi:hypothetical protein